MVLPPMAVSMMSFTSPTRQPVARGGFAVDVEVEVVAAGRALGEGAARVREIAQALSRSATADVLDLLEVGAEDLDAENRCERRS